jgi:hypothetical protein
VQSSNLFKKEEDYNDENLNRVYSINSVKTPVRINSDEPI